MNKIFIYFLTQFILIRASKLAWDYSISAAVASASWTSWPFVTRDKTYYVNIRILKDNSPCLACAISLSSIGGSPILLVGSDQSTFAYNDSNYANPTTFTSSSGYWSIPIHTSSPGEFKFSISSSLSNFTYPPSSKIPDLTSKILVNWLADDGLATFSGIAGDTGVGLTIKRFPALSSNWLAILLDASGKSILLATPDEYQTTYEASLLLPTSIYSSDACTGSSISSLIWNDIAFYHNLLFLSTNGGLLQAQKNSAGSDLAWRSVIQTCIGKIKQHSQKYIESSYWNPLIIIGKDNSLYIVQNQTATALQLLDNQSQTLKDALFPSSTSFSIIDAVTTSLKKVILFLVSSSSQYFLVTFDFQSLVWKVTFRFPSTVPLYTSSSTNTYMRIWNTTSSNSAFDGITNLNTTAIPLTLTGLETSSNPSFDIFILGNALFFSESFGLSISLIHSLSTATFNSFSSSNSGSFSIGASDSRLWIGSLGASYLIEAVSSRSTPGLYHSFFDHSGNLNELSYSSNGTFRISYEFASFLSSGTSCLYSNLSFVYFPELSFFSTIPLSNAVNTSISSNILLTSTTLPDTVHLDYLEEYEFQIRIIPTNWSEADDLTLSFQLQNSSQIFMTIFRSYDYFRQTIIYDVSLKDTGISNSSSVSTTNLNVIVNNDNLSCQNYGGKSIVISSGCRPKSYLALSLSESGGVLYPCPYTKNDIPCAIYEEEFKPVFHWIDTIQNLNSTFQDDYTIKVVAGGASASSIQSFDSAQIARYNPSSSNSWLSYIWISKSQSSSITPTFNLNDNSIYWKCELYSACQYTSGIYYLTLQVQGNSTDSYCTVNNQFQIALVNIPYPFSYDIATALSVCAGCFLVLAVYIWYDREVLGLSSKSLSAKRKLAEKVPSFKTIAAQYMPRFSTVARDSQAAINSSFRNNRNKGPISSKPTIGRKVTVQFDTSRVPVVKSAKFADSDSVEDSRDDHKNSRANSFDDNSTDDEVERQDKLDPNFIEKNEGKMQIEPDWNGDHQLDQDEYRKEYEYLSEDDDEDFLEDIEMQILDGFIEAKDGESGVQIENMNISMSSLNEFLSLEK